MAKAAFGTMFVWCNDQWIDRNADMLEYAPPRRVRLKGNVDCGSLEWKEHLLYYESRIALSILCMRMERVWQSRQVLAKMDQSDTPKQAESVES